jgi:hypothetical protein
VEWCQRTCGEACGCDGAIDCRVWVWQGQEHTQAPAAMIVDAWLHAPIYSNHTILKNFLLLAIVGLIAQLVDGSLGMSYGVTSQSLLLTVCIAPAHAGGGTCG